MSEIETFTIKRNDTSPLFEHELTPTPDLTGATVVFNMKTTGGVSKVNRGAATIVGDPTLGIVRYSWLAADTNTAGLFNAEYEVTYANGKIETFPNDSYIRVKVTEDLG